MVYRFLFPLSLEEKGIFYIFNRVLFCSKHKIFSFTITFKRILFINIVVEKKDLVYDFEGGDFFLNNMFVDIFINNFVLGNFLFFGVNIRVFELGINRFLDRINCLKFLTGKKVFINIIIFTLNMKWEKVQGFVCKALVYGVLLKIKCNSLVYISLKNIYYGSIVYYF